MTIPTRPWEIDKLRVHPLSTQTVSASLPSSESGRFHDFIFLVLNSDYAPKLVSPQHLGATSAASFSLSIPARLRSHSLLPTGSPTAAI